MENTIRHLSANPTMKGQVNVIPDVVYSTKQGEELKLTLLVPWTLEAEQMQRQQDPTYEITRRPLILFVQGSAWTTPNIYYELEQLGRFVRAGYVVATVVHRDRTKGHFFPAFLQDVKCALRFLRANAQKYGIDPGDAAVWGTSSGGNTAMLLGVTGDWEIYKTEEYAEYSDAVQAVISCFGPSDLVTMAQMAGPEVVQGICQSMFGEFSDDYVDNMRKMSPRQLLEQGKEYPPFLLLHGNADELVHVSQMHLMYQSLLEHGVETEAWEIDGAPHEGPFWSDPVYEVILEFIKKHIPADEEK